MGKSAVSFSLTLSARNSDNDLVGTRVSLELDTAIAFKGEMQRDFAWVIAMRTSCGDSGEDPERILVSWGRRACGHVAANGWHWLGQKSKQLLYRHPCNLRGVTLAPRDVYRGDFTTKADRCIIWETWPPLPILLGNLGTQGFPDPNSLSGLAPKLKTLL